MHEAIDILSEREVAGGWTFEVGVTPMSGPEQRCTMKLSFADYNLWSAGGTDAPAQVARAAMAFMRSRMNGEALPSACDASLARRKFSDADAMIPTMIRT